jgi:hypothetical protein
MQHVSFRVKGEKEMLALRDRIRSHGVPVLGPVDHGMCHSMYFAGPENLSLEISYDSEPLNPKAWIDPEVVGLCGISTDELDQYKKPETFVNEDSVIAQPGIDSKGPHMSGYPDGAYELVLSLTDTDVAAMMQENEPPVKV